MSSFNAYVKTDLVCIVAFAVQPCVFAYWEKMWSMLPHVSSPKLFVPEAYCRPEHAFPGGVTIVPVYAIKAKASMMDAPF
jgi:hypothetical protein